MAKNTGKGYRQGAIRDRSQTYNPVTGQWIKRDGTTGQFLDVKQDGEPFKSVRKEDPA
jgi:2-cysteine adaptor domain